MINKITNVQFIGNKTYRTGYATIEGNYHASGGAMDNYGHIGEISNVLFYQNSAETESASAVATSGAFMNLATDKLMSGTIDQMENVQFIENHAFAKRATAKGGAMSSGTGEGCSGTAVITEMKNVIFKGNYAQSGDEENVGSYASGGALDISGEIKNFTGYFEGNYTKSNQDVSSLYGSKGGALYNDGNIENMKADFKGNYALIQTGSSAADGGAIYNIGTIDYLTGNYTENYASSDKGGADGGAIKNNGNITNITGYFEQNYVESGFNKSGSYGARGGAVRNAGNIKTLTADFKGNYASNFVGSSSAGGGAIYHNGSIDIITGNFTENYAFSEKGKANGGAVLNYNSSLIGKIKGHFINNKASSEEKTANGGALYNGGQIDFVEGDFISNSAISEVESFGGGIYNKGTVNLYDSSFISNKADKGAAIYSATGSLSLTAVNKDVEISNNNQTGKAGGSGTGVYIESGTLILNAATNRSITINDLMYSDGSIKINTDDTYNGGKIEINNKIEGNGQFDIQNGYVRLGSDSGISATSSRIGKNAVFDVASNTVSLGDTQISGLVRMDITNIEKDSPVYSGGKINTTGLNIDDTARLSLLISNGLMEEKGSKTGDLELISQPIGTAYIFKNIAANNRYVVEASRDELGEYNGKYKIGYIATASDIVEEANGSQNNMRAGEAWDKVQIEGGEGREIQNLLNELSQQDAQGYKEALTNLAPTDTMLHVNMTEDMNKMIGDQVVSRLNEEGKNSGDVFEEKGGWIETLYNKSKLNKTYQNEGFKGKTAGVAFGIDGKTDEETTVGVGYAYGKTKVDSGKRKTDVGSHTIYVYSKYQPSKFYVSGMASYGFAKYDERVNVAGLKNESHYNVRNYGARGSIGYEFENGITPKVGLRMTHIERESYTDSVGQYVKTKDEDILTAEIGIRYGMKFERKDMVWKPRMGLSLVYDMFKSNSDAEVRIGNSSYIVEGPKLNRYGIEFGLGTEVSVGNWDLLAEYNLASRKDYRSHTGLLKARYNF